MTDSVTRKLVRRDFSDHDQHEGNGYDVLAKGKEPYDRDTVIGKAKFSAHTQFNNGLQGLDVGEFIERVVEDSEVYIFDSDKLTEQEEEVLRIEEKIVALRQKKAELVSNSNHQTTTHEE